MEDWDGEASAPMNTFRPIAIYGPPGGQCRLNSADYGPQPIIATDDVDKGRYPFPSVAYHPGLPTTANLFFESRGQQDVPVPGYPWYGQVIQVPPDPVNDWFLLPQDPATMASHPKWWQLPPLVPDMRRLHVNGHVFELENGLPWTAIECSDFNLFGRALNGEDITPVLRQRADIGFNLLRVWTLYDIVNIGKCVLADHPSLYNDVPTFLRLCASHGLRVEFTAYTGRDYWTDREHWARLGAACVGAPNVLLDLINESDQPHNTIDLSPFAPISGVLCSHGSNGSQAWPVAPYWDYGTFHTNGAPEEQRKVGHNAMEIDASRAFLTNETSRYPEVGMWAGASLARQRQLAYDSAAGAALLCAGSCFHSVLGKTSSLFDGDHEAVARDWVLGAQSVNLHYQHGAYAHRQDLERPGLLRVYDRHYGADDFVVDIRE